jgi:capsular polysaccharide transport system permease protein
MFRQIVNRAAATIESNRTLLYHRQISLFDLLLARSVLDLVGTSLAFFVLLAATAVVGLGGLPDRPLLMLLGLFLMFWLSLSFSLLICALSEFSTAVERLVHPLTYISMPLSGVFFLAESMPAEYRDIMMWGPLIHILQLIRMGQYGNFNSHYVQIWFVLVWCIILTFLGLLSLRSVRARMALE